MSQTFSLEIGGRILSLEMGAIGRQADGAVIVRYGDTVMFVSATSKKEAREDKPFLPLIVDYRENTYAAGKIPGGFFKREGRPSEREILVARLIDRPIRPLFPEGYHCETQVVGLLLSYDQENEPDTLGVIGASAALYLSDIPFTVPLGAVKVGLRDGNFVINPTSKEIEQSPLNLLAVGTEDGVTMIECGGREVEEETIVGAISAAREAIRKIIEIQKEQYHKLGVQKRPFTAALINETKYAEIEAKIGPTLKAAIQNPGKKASEAAVDKILEDLLAGIPEENDVERAEVKNLFERLEEKTARRLILDEGIRPDGRGPDDIRPIAIEVGLLPRTHGSALFTRGETQCLATVTLGTFEDVQRLDSLGE
jgi:polyribonucleotide nucleotidyltransferase